MFSASHTLQKSRLISAMTLERVGDYLDLLRVEVKIRQHDLGIKLVGFAVAGLFALLSTIFLGLAIIVTFWDSDYRALAAWFVVVLYGAIAAISIGICMKHFRSQSIANSLKQELHQDIATIKGNL